MTAPNVVRDLFLSALEQTVNAGGQMLSGMFRLAFLFPAIVCLFFVEVCVWLERAASASPAIKVISIAAVRRAPAVGREGA